MFVVSRRNIILPGPNGERFKMEKDYMGPVPAWAEDSAYLKALAADGKVILSERGTDKDFEKKEKPPKKESEEKPKEEDPAPSGQEERDALAE